MAIRDAEGQTCLAVAKANVVPALVSSNADPNQVGKSGEPISFAAAASNPKLLEALLKARADPNLASNRVALHCAVAAKQASCCKLLLESLADATAKTTQNNVKAPLQMAKDMHWAEGVRMLTAAVGAQLAKEQEALRAAEARKQSQAKSVKSLLPLLKSGHLAEVQEAFRAVDVHGALPDGETVLFVAAARRDRVDTLEICKFLVEEAHVDCSVVSQTGETALFKSAVAGNVGVCEFLVARQCSLAQENSSGQTPLCVAAAAGQSAVVSTLLSSRADPEHRDRQQQTPLFAAARLQDDGCMRFLLRARANPEALDERRQPPLFSAAAAGKAACARMLLAANASPATTDPHGRTALYYAVRETRVTLCMLLLQEGVDRGGNRSLDVHMAEMARERGLTEVQERLLPVHKETPPLVADNAAGQPAKEDEEAEPRTEPKAKVKATEPSDLGLYSIVFNDESGKTTIPFGTQEYKDALGRIAWLPEDFWPKDAELTPGPDL